MMKMMKKLMEDKGMCEMDPTSKKAKSSVLQEISDMAGKSMGEDVKGIKKVSVMSNDSSGLKEGLDKAKELVEGKDESANDESPAEEDSELSDMSPEEIDALLKKLMEMKKNKA